jgi:pyruvate formate lyase activating enzyme
MEGKLFRKINDRIECLACARKCNIPKNLHGFCGTRYNINGKLICLNYGIFSSIALDPIEKKPFYHFYPGHTALSLGTTGCSWACKYCLNYDISQRKEVIGFKIEPREIVEIARDLKSYGLISICFTYNEPSIYPEYCEDVAKLAKNEGFKVTWVSNGYLTDEAIDFASKFLDAITIDIKGNGSDKFARNYILIRSYEPVFHAIEELYKKSVHVEITDLVVPKVGDDLSECKRLCKFLKEVLGENSNIHFLRFFPSYKMKDFPATPLKILEKHAEIAKEEEINYVYLGNVPGHPLENTYCPNCGSLLIKREGFCVHKVNLNKNRCPCCGTKIFLSGEASVSKLIYPIPLHVNKPLIKREVRDGKIYESKINL